MSETRTVFIPAIALDYENNLLESVSVGGETFFRKQRDWRAIAKSREQTIERMGAENAKLRELVSDYAAMSEYLLARQPMLFPDKANELRKLDEKRQELGIKVSK